MSSGQQQPLGSVPTTTATPILGPEQSQPVDLATTAKQPLRIPSVPRPPNPNPARSTGAVAILSNTATSATPIRASPVSSSRPLLAVPKAMTSSPSTGQVNLAVMNKVTVLTTSNPPSAKNVPLAGSNVPRATATTIVRPPTSYPLTIKSPGSSNPLGAAGNTTSIRLTTATPGSQPGSSVQLVPMSIPASIRPQGTQLRPGLPSPSGARGTTSFRPAAAATISDAVRVTLVQSPASGKPPQGPGGPGMASITTTSAPGVYKQFTITQPAGPKAITPSATTVRIPATSKMTVLPTAPFQTVSLAPTTQQINVPLAPAGRAITAGKLISASPITPPSVTIQKSTIPVSSQSPRTISLPYAAAAAQVAAIPKPVSQAIPVARVCPQPNVVTITTTVGNVLPVSTGQQQGSVFIARSNVAGTVTTSGSVGGGQAVAINLSNNPTTLNLSKTGPGLNTTKITVPGTTVGGGQARLVNLPAQPVQYDMDANKMTSSSPSRPSILRRREGDRDVSLPEFGETPPPRPDSRNDDAGSSSSGSTTLSATSSPGMTGDRAGNLSGGEEPNSTLQPSPRKKPRKQTLTSTSVRPGSEQQWGGDQEQNPVLRRKLPGGSSVTASNVKSTNGPTSTQQTSPAKPTSNYISDKPHMSLLNSYRHTWKSRHNHFLRHSDVRPRVEPLATVNEVANQKHIMQKINGWKIYHVISQMEDVMDMETELTARLGNLQKRLDKNAINSEVSKDVNRIQELIKANLQRSKAIQDQMKENKEHTMELLEYKSRVSDILHKYMSKRSVKKREVK